MDETPQTRSDPAPTPDAATDTAEFAAIRRPRTRHPILALAAGVLALFLVIKIRADVTYFFASRQAEDLGDARTLVTSDRGRAVLAEGTNRMVRVHGTPDREGALQVDTKGSWTFSQFLRLLGTDSRLFVYRREDPLPAFRAEQDVFEGRLIRFADLSFADSIRAYFAGHVTATHFFRAEDLRQVVASGVGSGTAVVKDLTGDGVTLGPNDIVAITVVRPNEFEIAFPAKRFVDAKAAAAALVERHARILGPGREAPPSRPHHAFIVAIPEAEHDQALHAIGDIDYQTDIRAVRESIKVRLADLTTVDGKLAVRAGAVATTPPGAPSAPAQPGATARDDATAEPARGPRVLTGIESIRTLATIQVPSEAYLILEADQPKDHLVDVAMALVLLVFAGVNLIGLARGLSR